MVVVVGVCVVVVVVGSGHGGQVGHGVVVVVETNGPLTQQGNSET